jgi:hypothetical protein
MSARRAAALAVLMGATAGAFAMAAALNFIITIR